MFGIADNRNGGQVPPGPASRKLPEMLPLQKWEITFTPAGEQCPTTEVAYGHSLSWEYGPLCVIKGTIYEAEDGMFAPVPTISRVFTNWTSVKLLEVAASSNSKSNLIH